MRFSELGWRDRILLVNSVLFCALGALLVARWALGQAAALVGGLGLLLLVFGVYRLVMARKEMRRRAGNRKRG